MLLVFVRVLTVRAKTARAEAARRDGTYITCRAHACRADEKTGT